MFYVCIYTPWKLGGTHSNEALVSVFKADLFCRVHTLFMQEHDGFPESDGLYDGGRARCWRCALWQTTGMILVSILIIIFVSEVS